MAVANCPFTGAALTLHEQPYDKEPDRSPTLRPASVEPFNGEPALPLLVQSFLTPTPQFFVRNHSAVPHIDPSTYRLEVAIGGGSAADAQPRSVLSLSLSELRGEDTSRFRFRAQTMTCTLQCAGNRRTEMNAVHKVKGLGWGAGAVGNATWMGVWLRDVLSAAATGRLPAEGEAVNGRTLLRGVGSESGAALHHVEFEGWDGVKEHDFRGQGYASSVPLGKCTTLVETPLLRRSTTTTALQEEDGESPSVAGVMLAFAMNGAPLTADHGAPLRVVVPGFIGARSVKWLRRVRLLLEPRRESANFFQTRDYKLFPPSVGWHNVTPELWDRATPIQEMNVNCVVCVARIVDAPTVPTATAAGEATGEAAAVAGAVCYVDAAGYAIAGGGRPIERVDVSGDGGETWAYADELFVRDGFSWGLWRARRIPVAVRRRGEAGTGKQKAGGGGGGGGAIGWSGVVAVRAWDSASNGMPESMAPIWNLRGVLGNAWHRAPVSHIPSGL